MDYVAENIPGGVDAQREVLSRMGGEALAAFFDQTFYATSWYDVVPLILAGFACAEVTGVTYEEFLNVRTLHQVKQDLTLIRRAFVRISGPRAVAIRLPRITASYFDFLEVTSEATSKNDVVGELAGIPDGEIFRWFRIVCEVFVGEVLVRAGAPNHRFEWGRKIPHEEVQGIQTYRRPYLIHWGDE